MQLTYYTPNGAKVMLGDTITIYDYTNGIVERKETELTKDNITNLLIRGILFSSNPLILNYKDLLINDLNKQFIMDWKRALQEWMGEDMEENPVEDFLIWRIAILMDEKYPKHITSIGDWGYAIDFIQGKVIKVSTSAFNLVLLFRTEEDARISYTIVKQILQEVE